MIFEAEFDALASPVTFLKGMLGRIPQEENLAEYASWWEAEGMLISDAVDRGGTPWVRMFDAFGERVDEILFPPEYWMMLRKGYRAGAVWRAFEEDSLVMPYLLGYITCFHDPGVYCPYLVSLSTAVPLKKYGAAELQGRFLPSLLWKDERVWQGATWMTEAKGGSDLGATVETIARPTGDHWSLNGDKYFASNVGAELAIVAARPEGASRNVRGLALFLVPRYRADRQLNYFIRRLKNKIGTRSVPTGEVELRDSEAFLLGKAEWGIYLILEALNLSRVGNSVGSVALAQRALADALAFARRRNAFGRPIVEHPLLARQFEERLSELKAALALTLEAIQLLDQVWKETPPYSDRYHLFRLVAHLTKYWTAELAVQFAKWNMEVHGGAGVLAEYRARTVAAGSDDSADLGGHGAPADARRVGGDGAQKRAPPALPLPSTSCRPAGIGRDCLACGRSSGACPRRKGSGNGMSLPRLGRLCRTNPAAQARQMIHTTT